MDNVIERLRACAETGERPLTGDLTIAVRRLEKFQRMCKHLKQIAAPGCAPECEECGKLFVPRTQAQMIRDNYFNNRRNDK